MASAHLFSITAIKRLIRFTSVPVDVLLGSPKAVGTTKACTSTKIGLLPSIRQATAAPVAFLGLPESINSEGFFTSISPACCISNTPISLVEPNLFFTARSILYEANLSPSKYSTVSTICSKTLGPATCPSLVT